MLLTLLRYTISHQASAVIKHFTRKHLSCTKIKSFDKEIMSLTWRCNILSRIHYGEHMAANKFDEYAW